MAEKRTALILPQNLIAKTSWQSMAYGVEKNGMLPRAMASR